MEGNTWKPDLNLIRWVYPILDYFICIVLAVLSWAKSGFNLMKGSSLTLNPTSFWTVWAMLS